MLFRTLLAVFFAAIFAQPAFAADPQAGEHTVAIFLAQIALMLLVGRLLGELMQRVGQPAVMGQLIAGVLIGPSVLGNIWPDAHSLIFPDTPTQKVMIDAVSQLGILMLLLLTGMETDLELVKRRRHTAFFTSISGIIFPFAAGFTLGQVLPESMLPDPSQRVITSLFLAVALSISSVKIVAVVLMEVDFFRRNVGQIIMASAILDDTVAWVLIAIIGGLALHGGFDFAGLTFIVAGTLIFFALSLTVGRRVVAYVIRWSNDNLLIEMPVITTILIITLAMALITDYLGVHTVLGAFVAGILIGQSPLLTRHIDEQLRGMIVALFMPVFFAVAGLSIDVTSLGNPRLMLLAVGFILIATIGKLGGCYLGARLGGMTTREALAVGVGLNARGSTEVIVASVGLSMGVLSRDLYTLIVFMAVFTTMIMPPLLRWALKRIPPSEEEQARLEQAEREAKEFVPNVERLLVAVDGGNNGKLAARIAGLLAGSRGIPTTVLDLSPAADNETLGETEQIAKTSAELASLNVHAAQTDPSKAVERPSLIAQTAREELAEAVLKEARKGYAMLMLGVTHAFGADPAKPGQFHPGIEKLVAEFTGATAIVLARKGGPAPGEKNRLDILLPTTSTDYSRRAAEVAIAIAKGGRGRVTAMHVTPRPDENIMLRWLSAANMRRPPTLVPAGIPSIEHVQELAKRHGVPVIPLLVSRATPEAAIQEALRKINYDLMVLGVTARPGEGQFFGYNTAAILERTRCSFLVVSS